MTFSKLNLPDCLFQNTQLVRFLNKSGQTFADEFLCDLLLVIAAGHYDFDVRLELPQLTEALLAVHVRHGQVQDNEADVRVLFEPFYSLAAIIGGDDRKAKLPEHFCADAAHGFFVIDQQYGAFTLPVVMVAGTVEDFGRSAAGGEQNFEGGARFSSL